MNLFASPSIQSKVNGTTYDMYEFAKAFYGKNHELDARYEFLKMDPEDYEDEQLFMEVFIVWYLYSRQSHRGKTIAQEYLRLHKRNLPEFEKDFIRTTSRNIYSFYQIHEVSAGHYLILKDLISGEMHLVFEKLGTHQYKAEDIIFTKLGFVQDLKFLIGATSFVLPCSTIQEIDDFRRKRSIRNYEMMRIILYYSLMAEVMARDQGALIPLG